MTDSCSACGRVIRRQDTAHVLALPRPYKGETSAICCSRACSTFVIRAAMGDAPPVCPAEVYPAPLRVRILRALPGCRCALSWGSGEPRALYAHPVVFGIRLGEWRVR